MVDVIDNSQDIYISADKDMRLEGLISSVDFDFCHWTKEYQYLYVNNRWTKGTDIASSLINKHFHQALASGRARAGGPSAKHHDPSRPQMPSYPCFILRINCPADDYDVFCESDKSYEFFTVETVFSTLIFSPLRKHNALPKVT